jgi:quercetin dioxygenase-like cupin family protein
MSDNLDPNRSTRATGAREVFSPEGYQRPVNENLTDVSGGEGDYCVLRCTLPAGAVVPMHSHADRETFYVLSGTLDALTEGRWVELNAGDIIDVKDGARHAWRNSSQAAASMLCVTTTKLARFLQAISGLAEGASPEEHAQRFFKLVREHGYWLASPEENAAVGLDANWSRPRD